MKNLVYIVFLMLVAGCTKTYKGLEETDMGGEDVIIDHGGEIPNKVQTEYKLIQVAISDPSYHTIESGAKTRAQGAFDIYRPDSLRDSVWEHARFILYAFADSEGIDYATTRKADSTVCLLDGEPSYVSDTVGYMLQYVKDETHNGAFCWPNDVLTKPYNFWGYYLDDAEVNAVTRNSEGITLDYNIDGSQDVLAGVAQIDDHQMKMVNNDADLFGWYYDSLVYKPMRERMYDYCSMTARHDLIPTLRLRHQLVRLKFEIYPGDSLVTTTKIDSFKVQAPFRAITKLAGPVKADAVTTWDRDTLRWHTLHDHDNSPVLHEGAYGLDSLWQEGDEELDLYERNHFSLGESLLLPPLPEGAVYYARMWTLRYDNFPDKTYENGAPTIIKAPAGGFRAGCQYTVRIGIFTQAEIETSVELSGWTEGASILLDPEDEGFIK